MEGNELAKQEDFGVVDVHAKVSMDDLLDLKVGEYEKQIRAATKEVEADNELICTELSKLQARLLKSVSESGTSEHKAMAADLLKAIAAFTGKPLDKLNISCSGAIDHNSDDKKEPMVTISVFIGDLDQCVRLHRKVKRRLTAEEKQIRKDIAKQDAALLANKQYLFKLNAAKAEVPLVRRDLKNEVTRRKLEAAGQIKLLESIDSFKLPTCPKTLTHK
jgi:hypothetical protein